MNEEPDIRALVMSNLKLIPAGVRAVDEVGGTEPHIVLIDLRHKETTILAHALGIEDPETFTVVFGANGIPFFVTAYGREAFLRDMRDECDDDFEAYLSEPIAPDTVSVFAASGGYERWMRLSREELPIDEKLN